MSDEVRAVCLSYAEMPNDMPKTIFEAIPLAIGKIKSVVKSGQNKAQGYDFVSHEDIAVTLNPILSECGITPVPQPLEIQRERSVTVSNSVMTKVVLTMKIRFYAKDGSYVEAGAFSEANDTSDKATPKAMTMAAKSIYKIIFCLPIQDTTDADYDHIEEQNPKYQQGKGQQTSKAGNKPNSSGYNKSGQTGNPNGQTSTKNNIIPPDEGAPQGAEPDGKPVGNGDGQDINAVGSAQEAIDSISGLVDVTSLTKYFNKHSAEIKAFRDEEYQKFFKAYGAKLGELRNNK